MSALHHLTVAEAAALIATRRLSPVELLEACLDRIAALDPVLNTVLRLVAEEARAEARNAEAEIARHGPRSPLHGIPIGLKDLIDLRGHPTTCHSALLADSPPAAEDAACVARLRGAGAVFPAKLATHEFAIGGPAFDLPFPPARNPWNRDHHPGGSSSGSGAAVAARMLPAALGTDTGGSVRHPASHCGLVGLKPGYDLIPRTGVFPLAWSLDHVGPLTRTVRDAALLLNAMVGQGTEGGTDHTRGLTDGVKGLRIGFVRHWHEADMPADPEMGAALEEAARVLSAEGASVTAVTLPRLQDFAAVNRAILYAEAAAVHGTWLRERPEGYAAITRRRLMPGLFLSAEDHVTALRARARLVAAVREAFRGCDLLLTASSMDPACRIDDPEAVERTYPRQARIPFNVTGDAAITLMSGLHATGLPLSVQLAAPAGREALLLRAAHAYERATPWKDMAPPEA
ncbi:MAG: amidase [Acetobacteraceae bacterium]|nr:amidase [Acetobacteraceae bacterium]